MQKFHIVEGEVDNHFLREGDVAAHALIGKRPRGRVIVGFPAGNSGAGLWTAGIEGLSLASELRPVRDGALRGVEMEIAVEGESLEIAKLALGNLRMLRLVDQDVRVDEGFSPRVEIEGSSLRCERVSLDGAHHYKLEIEAIGGSAEACSEGFLLRGAAPLTLRVRACTDEEPLQPLYCDDLLEPQAGRDQRSRDVFSFLCYEDKFCAGSWRFLTYFGRDTLLTLRLLMPVLSERAIEAGIASLLERLSPEGRVAHEEALGEWALHQDGHAPSYDWTMVDDDFMLACVIRHYACVDPRGRASFGDFLKRPSRRGETYGELLSRNLDYVECTARAFAEAPEIANLIRIDPHGRVGNWRDSQTGLAGGVYPWDVNVVLVPGALAASLELRERMGQSPTEAAEFWQPWSRARDFFEVTLPRSEAQRKIADYAKKHGLAPVSLDGDLRFDALALREDGSPVHVMQSDVGYQLLFSAPSVDVLQGLLELVERPFPAGLWTDVGLPVANPALATQEEAAGLGPGDYHGAVMWPWQHAMWILGLREQSERKDVPGDLAQRLRKVAAHIETRTRGIEDLRTAELWSWKVQADGSLAAIPFGQDKEHHAESNAAQLWSAVELVLGR
jgi:hypothetical protein